MDWHTENCGGDWETDGCFGAGDPNGGRSWRVWPAHQGRGHVLEGGEFERLAIERAEDDWFEAWVEDGAWQAICGPLNLDDALNAFLAWADPGA